jgi:hypothetical protein
VPTMSTTIRRVLYAVPMLKLEAVNTGLDRLGWTLSK